MAKKFPQHLTSLVEQQMARVGANGESPTWNEACILLAAQMQKNGLEATANYVMSMRTKSEIEGPK